MLPIEGIFGFTGEYRWLSNFWPVEVVLADLTYPTVEHAYQAAKTMDRDQRLYIQQLPTPALAKRAGKRITLVDDWEEVKVSVMRFLLKQKFSDKHPTLQLKLYLTGSMYIEETNSWGDTFWGVCQNKGKNTLGNLLMDVRKDITMLFKPA